MACYLCIGAGVPLSTPLTHRSLTSLPTWGTSHPATGRGHLRLSPIPQGNMARTTALQTSEAPHPYQNAASRTLRRGRDSPSPQYTVFVMVR